MFKRITQSLTLASIVGISQPAFAQASEDFLHIYPDNPKDIWEANEIGFKITEKDIDEIENYNIPYVIDLIGRTNFTPDHKRTLQNLVKSSNPGSETGKVEFGYAVMPFFVAYDNQISDQTPSHTQNKGFAQTPIVIDEDSPRIPNNQPQQNHSLSSDKLTKEESIAERDRIIDYGNKIEEEIYGDFNDDGQTSLESLVLLREFYYQDRHPKFDVLVFPFTAGIIREITELDKSTREENPEWAETTPEQRLEKYFPDPETRRYVQEFTVELINNTDISSRAKTYAIILGRHLLTESYLDEALPELIKIEYRYNLRKALRDYDKRDPKDQGPIELLDTIMNLELPDT